MQIHIVIRIKEKLNLRETNSNPRETNSKTKEKKTKSNPRNEKKKKKQCKTKINPKTSKTDAKLHCTCVTVSSFFCVMCVVSLYFLFVVYNNQQ